MDDLISRQEAISAVNTALFPKINTAKDAEKALKAFQDDYKLEVDGKYGPKSKAKLVEVVAKKK